MVYLSPETKAEFQRRAELRELTVSSWLLQAGLAYERMAKRGEKKHDDAKPETWASGYPKELVCFHCKKACHDPAVEHADQYPELHPDFWRYDYDSLRRLMKTKYGDKPNCGVAE